MAEFIRIKEGCNEAGKIGIVLWPAYPVKPYLSSGPMRWTAVVWDGEEDPDFHKSSCLEPAKPKKSVANRLRKRLI